MTPEQVRKLNELYTFMHGLKNAAQASPDVKKALNDIIIGTTSKTATSENQAVNEGGAGSYSVLGPPDGFITLNNKNIPYYN